jgi:copper(I)-binding protein
MISSAHEQVKKKGFMLLCLAISGFLAVAAGCRERGPAIRIESPEAAISPMLVGVASVFMRIVNTGGGDDVLLGARADVSETITELHDIQDGKMRKVESIPIPADGTVVLRPARFHIMIFKLPKNAREGYAFDLLLKFKKSGEKRVPLRLASFAPGRKTFQN